RGFDEIVVVRLQGAPDRVEDLGVQWRFTRLVGFFGVRVGHESSAPSDLDEGYSSSYSGKRTRSPPVPTILNRRARGRREGVATADWRGRRPRVQGHISLISERVVPRLEAFRAPSN